MYQGMQVEELNAIAAEDIQVGQLVYLHNLRPSRVTGPLYGGMLAVDQFGMLLAIGDEAAIARFYNGNMIEAKRLIETINGKIYIRDERFS